MTDLVSHRSYQISARVISLSKRLVYLIIVFQVRISQY